MSFRRSKFLARRRKKGHKPKIQGSRRGRKFVWIGILLLLALVFLDLKMRPIITSISGYQAEITMTNIMNQAANEIFQDESLSYSDFVTLTKNTEGDIASIETNTPKINLIQTQLTQKIINTLVNTRRDTLYVPLGTLLGFHLLSGRGPNIEIKVIPVGNVKTVVKSEFSSAGVNQTLHQITVEVDVTAMAIIPGYSTEVTVHTEYILAETMVVGDVPNSYAQILTEGESAIPYLADRFES